MPPIAFNKTPPPKTHLRRANIMLPLLTKMDAINYAINCVIAKVRVDLLDEEI